MAYRMSYTFEGNPRTRPEQNLSGASKKPSRDVWLQKTHEERRKRQEQRLKLRSAEILQSHIRSYLARKHKKEEERQLYDQAGPEVPVEMLLSKLLFFYAGIKDEARLSGISQHLLRKHEQIIPLLDQNPDTYWLIKRWLRLCLRSLHVRKDTAKLMMACLYTYTTNFQTVEYLVGKGKMRYFRHLRMLLETGLGSWQLEQDELMLKEVLLLIHRPFEFPRSKQNFDLIVSEFCESFLSPMVTPGIKFNVIPFLRNRRDFPYDKVVAYLNSGYHCEVSNSLFYCILALEPDDSEPTRDSVHALATLSSNLHRLRAPISMITDDSDDDDDDDDGGDNFSNQEEAGGSRQVSEEDSLLSDYLQIMNRPEKVRKWLHFCERNVDDADVMVSFTKLCHNLLLVYKDSVKKFLLLYKLGLNSAFVSKLWAAVNTRQSMELRGSGLATWKECHTNLSVFCDMFTFYTETLTDRENSDTSETFSQTELHVMSRLLKMVAVDLVEFAFPMCRSSTVSATPEILHLYSSCLNCAKMLYMLDMRKQFCPVGFWTSRKVHVSHEVFRRNYLTKTIRPFHGVVTADDDDSRLPPLSTIEQRSLAILQQLPFLIAFNTRVLLLRELCRNSLGESERLQHEYSSDSIVVIRRTHLYEDAFDKLANKNEFDLRHRVRIQFINSVGLEEAGIDGGGIFKEFINEVIKTAFDPNRGFFMLTADNTLYPNPNVHLIVENFFEHYYFIGRLVGKAIFENILVDLPLAEFFLAKLLVDNASAHYLSSLDPVLYKNLLYLRDFTGDVSDLGLDFTTVNNDLGETRITELKPNGRNIPVTNENRLEYIQLLADLKLNGQLKRQCGAFREGLDSVVPLLWLRLFNYNELQVIIGGDTQEIDLSDMQAYTVYGGEFTVDHPTVVHFWNILHKFTDPQKKQLLKFVTSCSRPPLLGFKELNPNFCIQSSGAEDRMPTASTCLNLLKLPIIREEEVLRNKILTAIEQQAGFELS